MRKKAVNFKKKIIKKNHNHFWVTSDSKITILFHTAPPQKKRKKTDHTRIVFFHRGHSDKAAVKTEEELS